MRQLSKKEAIILVEASRPVKCQKIEYWKDKSFTKRLFPAPEIPNLEFKNEMVPNFDIPNPNDLSKDTNQIELEINSSNNEDEIMPDIFNGDIDEENGDLYQPPNN